LFYVWCDALYCMLCDTFYDYWYSLGTGNSVIKALEILVQHDVDRAKVIVLSLFATPEGQGPRAYMVITLRFMQCPEAESLVPAYSQLLNRSKSLLIMCLLGLEHKQCIMHKDRSL